MKDSNSRSQWGSNIGFLMASIGSAVGLGNIWGFPYKMGANGGFAFLLIYVVLALVIGFAIMISEMAIGRKTKLGVLGAYSSLSKKFGWVGWLAVFSPFVIMSFYSVLGGYCFEYFFLNLSNLGFNAIKITGTEAFTAMLQNNFGCAFFTLVFIVSCLTIVRGGIKGGIEKFNNAAMPALFFMLVIVIIRSVTLPGAKEGLDFMFKPNLEPLRKNLIGVISTAGGQMFFSLSLAMGPIITYGSYLSKKENLVKNSLVVVIADTIVAIMAGLAVIPASFALGGKDASMAGPKLLFITLQDVFSSMGTAGPLFGVIFYLLVLVAAISSAISLIEVITAVIIDHKEKSGKKTDRKKITLWVCIAITVEAMIVAADSLGTKGLWIPFQNLVGTKSFNSSWLDFMDCLSEGIAMPLGAFFTSIMIGWELKSETIKAEVELEGNKFTNYRFYYICIKYIVPFAMAFILLGQLDAFFNLGIFG